MDVLSNGSSVRRKKKKDFVLATRSPRERSSSMNGHQSNQSQNTEPRNSHVDERRAGLTQRETGPCAQKAHSALRIRLFFVLHFKPPPFIHRLVSSTAHLLEHHSHPRRSTRIGTLPLALNREPLFTNLFSSLSEAQPCRRYVPSYHCMTKDAS